MLLQYPHGEEGLKGVTAQLAASGADTLAAVESVIGAANNPQRQAIGAGLAAAVNACSRQDSELTKKIRQAASGSSSSALQRSFNMAIDTSWQQGTAPAAATAAPAMPSAGLTPSLSGGLALPKSHGALGLSDPYGDPADWH